MLRKFAKKFPTEIWYLSACGFFLVLAKSALNYIPLNLKESFHLSTINISLIITLFGCFNIAGSYIGGRLTAHVGSYRIIQISSLSAFLLLAIMAWFYSPLAIILCLPLFGLFVNQAKPAINIAITKICPSLIRAQAFSIYRTIFSIAVVIGSACAAILLSINFQWLYIGGFIAALCGAFFAIFSLRKLSVHELEKNIDHTLETITKNLYNKKIIYLFFILCFISQVIYMQTAVIYPIYINTEYNASARFFAILNVINAICVILFEIPIINFLTRYSPLTICAIGSLLIALGFSMLPFGNSLTFLLISWLIITFGEMLFFSVSATSAALLTENSIFAGHYMGIFIAISDIAIIVSPLIGGLFYDTFGHNSFWYMTCAFTIILPCSFYYLRVRVC